MPRLVKNDTVPPLVCASESDIGDISGCGWVANCQLHCTDSSTIIGGGDCDACWDLEGLDDWMKARLLHLDILMSAPLFVTSALRHGRTRPLAPLGFLGSCNGVRV